MSACVRKSFQYQPSLPPKLEEQEVSSSKLIEKQGIVSILGSDCDQRSKAASLRRTLSADMSSKKWLAQNGHYAMKKIASSEELAISAAAAADHSFSSSSEDEYEGNKDELKRLGQDEVWRSIQAQKQKNEIPKSHGWTWGSILTQKNEESNNLPPPYIHPLVKRSASSLSEKSLEICTESLGSETGSDGFSSYSPSEAGDVDDEKEDLQQQQQSQSFDDQGLQFVKCNFSGSRKMPPRSFPPPLPSLAREDGASLRMHCHRQNGRLVLEAVSVPSQNYFHAQRQDGRLVLTLVNNPSQEARNEEMEDEIEGYTQVFDDMDEIEGNEADFKEDGYEIEDEEDEEEDQEVEMEEKFEKENEKRSEMEFVLEQQNSKLPGGVINVHKSAMVMKKPMALDNKNLTWSPKFNKAINLIGIEEVVEDELTHLPQSLPPPPRVARLMSATGPPASAAASFNSYEYFWRDKPSVASIIKPISEKSTPFRNKPNKVILPSNLKGYEQQNLVVMRGNRAENLVPSWSRCNEQRRSLLLWEPYCIATS